MTGDGAPQAQKPALPPRPPPLPKHRPNKRPELLPPRSRLSPGRKVCLTVYRALCTPRLSRVDPPSLTQTCHARCNDQRLWTVDRRVQRHQRTPGEKAHLPGLTLACALAAFLHLRTDSWYARRPACDQQSIRSRPRRRDQLLAVCQRKVLRLQFFRKLLDQELGSGAADSSSRQLFGQVTAGLCISCSGKL